MVSLPEALSGAAAGQEQLPREVMEEHQRERVVKAAIDVFAKRGFPGTTVDHLVEASQTGVGSFYSLFDGKEDCMLRAFELIVSEARQRIESAVPGDRSWPEQTCAALQELLAFIAEQPLAARVALVEVQAAGSKALQRYGAIVDEGVELLRDCRARTSGAAHLPGTLEEATVTGIAWLLHQRLVMGEMDDIKDLLPELADIVLEPYLGHEEAGRVIAGFTAQSG